jgi:hypothetical protein
MKTWTQEMLPLKIIKDLGLIYATPHSIVKIRYIEFECPECKCTFRAEPSKVLKKIIIRCSNCSYSKNVPKIDVETNTKKCIACSAKKDISMFYKNSRRSNGLDNRCKKCADAYKAEWIVTSGSDIKASATNSRLLKRYGITSEEYMQLLENQNYSCAICGNTPENGRSNTYKLSVDHCHTTGTVRGLLCQKCNTGIGLLGDTKEGILKALKYLDTLKEIL